MRDPSEQQLTASSTDFEQLLQPVQDKLPRNPSENWQKPRSEHHQQYQAQQKTNNFDNHLASNTIGEPSNHAIFKLTQTLSKVNEISKRHLPELKQPPISYSKFYQYKK